MAAEFLTIFTSYVSPGGVCVSPRKGGYITCRATLGHIDAEDGLVREMQDGGQPIPWETEAVRNEAMDSIAGREGMNEDLRAGLLAHIRRTPFYRGPNE